MIDINKLRRLAHRHAQCALSIPIKPAMLSELLDRLEEAESECLEQARLNGMGSEREAALMAKLEAAEKERDEFKRECFGHISDNSLLRAKVEQMEKQEPVGRVHRYGRALNGSAWLGVAWNPEADELPTGTALYALPGAQSAQSIPDDVMRDAKRYRFLRAAKNIPISTEAARDPIVYDAAIDAAMLAAAPEAKPCP